MRAFSRQKQSRLEQQADRAATLHGRALTRGKGSGPLDVATRSHSEPRFGHDFSRVRIHDDAATADDLAADAYTAGNDIYFAPGQYAPGTAEGGRLLAHELAHVVQQSSSQAPAGMPQRRASAEQIRLAEEAHVRQQRRIASLLAEPTRWGELSGRVPAPAPVTFEEHKPEDPARVLRNTTEWIRRNLAKLVVLTPVPGKPKFYFDATVDYPNVGGQVANEISYEDYVRAQTDTETRRIFLPVRDTTTDDDIRNTLTHEVQHLADVSTEDRPAAAAAFAGDKQRGEMFASSWIRYQKEFRAYWLESLGPPSAADASGQLVSGPPGRFGSPGGPGGPYTSKGGQTYKQDNPQCVIDPTVTFKNEKQLRIASHLIENDSFIKGSFHCSDLFRLRVQELDNPESRNFINSVRIEMLRQALREPRQVRGWGRPALVKAAQMLDDVDRAFLKSPAAQPFWDDAKRLLAPELYTWLYELVFNGKDVPLPAAAAATPPSSPR